MNPLEPPPSKIDRWVHEAQRTVFPFQWQTWLSNARNWILGLDSRVTDIETLLAIMEAISVEEAILRGSTTFTGQTVTNYPDSYKPSPPVLSDSPQLITLDETAGTITVGYSGIYTISGYIAQTGGTVNNQYVMYVTGSVFGNFPFGTGTWNNQTGGLVYYAAGDLELAAGEVITLTSGTNVPVIVGSNLHVELKSLDSFV